MRDFFYLYTGLRVAGEVREGYARQFVRLRVAILTIRVRSWCVRRVWVYIEADNCFMNSFSITFLEDFVFFTHWYNHIIEMLTL